MLANSNIISCNFSSFPTQGHDDHPPKIPSQKPRNSPTLLSRSIGTRRNCYKNGSNKGAIFIKLLPLENSAKGRSALQKFCYSSSNTEKVPQKVPFLESEVYKGGGGEGRLWMTSILLFAFYAGVMYYVLFLAPNQNPSKDLYLLKKLLYVIGDDGFRMNEVFVAVWYMVGVSILEYSMLLLPSARSKKNSLPVWPFLILSTFLGAYVLIPYFIIWRPPPPPLDETELRSWPLNFLDSKLTAGIALAAGLGLIAYAGLSNAAVWKEFFLSFGSSRLVHGTCIDFSLLSSFAPFWVYNDMTVRKWYRKGSWLLPLTLVPLFGPALYLLLRPPLSVVPALVRETTLKEIS